MLKISGSTVDYPLKVPKVLYLITGFLSGSAGDSICLKELTGGI